MCRMRVVFEAPSDPSSAILTCGRTSSLQLAARQNEWKNSSHEVSLGASRLEDERLINIKKWRGISLSRNLLNPSGLQLT